MIPVLLAAVAYLLGSIPFGLWLVKAWKGIDVREVGSKNIGTTNVYRAAGKGAAAAVFLLDVAKGYAPVLVALLLAQPAWVAVLAGAMAIVGHSKSVFLKFTGGKSVATGIGTIFAISPVAAGVALGIFALVFAPTRMVSAGSIVAALSLPPLMVYLKLDPVFVGYAAAAAAYVVVRHRENIQRIFQGQERRL
ncbi:MAG: acyl-phosphate glycerol-3-phosphate acyltransferase [Cyanobacteria bacterium RYN_339]|nr:acyl-phosphate glycerol-3-phosphate acyltransferase [Cyanobacteria bacterium RYN_339]